METAGDSRSITNCIHGQEPPCSAVCPFGLDVRGFAEKCARSSFPAAYRLYRNAVVFPGVASAFCPAPCMGVCEREGQGGPLDMPALERAAVSLAGTQPPPRYNLAARKETVAVLGAGVAGLACALRLSARRYAVTVYEPSQTLMPEFEGMDIAGRLRDEAAGFFVGSGCDFKFGVSAQSALAQSSGSDAVCVCGHPDGTDPAEDGLRVFRSQTGLDPVGEILAGARLADEVESFFKTGLRAALEEKPARPPHRLSVKREFAARVEPASPGGYDADEAAREAARCMSCECEACADVCPLLRKYATTPDRLYEDIQITLHPSVYTKRVGMRVMNACSACGLCERVCPEGVEVVRHVLEGRAELVRQGAMPAAFHDYWIRDMRQALSEEARVTVAREIPASQLYFPGCQLSASRPDLLLSSWNLLRSVYGDGAALMVSCCSEPARWAGDRELARQAGGELKSEWERLGRPRIIAACASCISSIGDLMPEAQVVSVYEVLCTEPFRDLLPNRSPLPEGAVFDPCASAPREAMRNAVRQLLEMRGVHPVELPLSGEKAACCGWGGHPYSADPVLAGQTADCAADMGGEDYYVYCANCLDVLAARGKTCRHALEALLDDPGSGPHTPVSLSMRRDNRARLRKAVVEGADLLPDPAPEAPGLIIPHEVRRMMDAALILDEDVEAVIAACGESGEAVMKEDGTFAGHLRIGHVTYWAEWSGGPESGPRTLISAYAHRMSIAGEDGRA